MAWRSSIFTGVPLATTGAVGWLARDRSNETAPWKLHALAFAAVAVARYVSPGFLSVQYEPEAKSPPNEVERFRPSVAPAGFAMANALLNGATLLAGRFFAVWFLRDLGFSYLVFAVAGACTVMGQLVANRFVGRLTDDLGAAWVLRVGGVLAALVPVPCLWIESAWAVYLADFGSGVVWASVDLAAFKYLAQVSHGGPNRSDFVCANLWLTSTMLVRGLAGGLIAPRLPTLFSWPVQTLFLLSAVLRIAVEANFFARLVDLEAVDATRRWGGPGSSQV